MKQAAAKLNITQRTIAFHKYRIMKENKKQFRPGALCVEADRSARRRVKRPNNQEGCAPGERGYRSCG
jgi:hypothetical protein